MLRIGLTGGIASGKSTAAQRCSTHGATIVDHDALAKRAVEPGQAALVDIVKAFGDRVIVDGELNRSALAELVFNDAGARATLNDIVHPTVRAMALAADKQARLGGAKVVVHDIPLLVETGQGGDFPLVVTVSAPEEIRIERLVKGRGMRLRDARARIAAQATDAEREAVADMVLDGGGTVEHIHAQVDACWELHIPHLV